MTWCHDDMMSWWCDDANSPLPWPPWRPQLLQPWLSEAEQEASRLFWKSWMCKKLLNDEYKYLWKLSRTAVPSEHHKSIVGNIKGLLTSFDKISMKWISELCRKTNTYVMAVVVVNISKVWRLLRSWPGCYSRKNEYTYISTLSTLTPQGSVASSGILVSNQNHRTTVWLHSLTQGLLHPVCNLLPLR